MLALPLLAALAQAASPEVDAVLSAEFAVSDPYVERRGLRLAGELSATPWFRVTLGAGGYPNLGRADHTALTRYLIDELDVSPSASRILWRADLGLRFVPLTAQVGSGQTLVGLGLSLGLVGTADEQLGASMPAAPHPTDNQVLPLWGATLDAEYRWRRVGLRGSFARTARRESVRGVRSPRSDLWLGLSLVYRATGTE